MDWLNFQHLLYFSTVVREGSVTAAARALRLSHATVSQQIHALEESLGEPLLERSGRRRVPTEMGRIVDGYARDIFALGRELQDTVRGRPTGKAPRLVVGVMDSLPKLLVRRLLEPVLSASGLGAFLVCVEDAHEQLLARLSTHEVDVVLADAPATSAAGTIRAFNHVLGSCGVTVFGHARFAAMRDAFPRSLDGAPMLLPLSGTTARRLLDAWFDRAGVRPRVVGEFEDSALLKVIGESGVGLFTAPAAIEREVAQKYNVMRMGRLDGVEETFFAISVERRVKNPAVLQITQAAHKELFAARRRRS